MRRFGRQIKEGSKLNVTSVFILLAGLMCCYVATLATLRSGEVLLLVFFSETPKNEPSLRGGVLAPTWQSPASNEPGFALILSH